LFKTIGTIILASNSPRRKQFLSSLKIAFEAIPADVDETFMPDETFRDHVLRLSMEKSHKIARRYPDAYVLGADTFVVIDGIPLGKPADKKEAKKMLETISGKTHTVFTGFSVVHQSTDKEKTGVIETQVTIKKLTAAEIDAYLSTAESLDKAGAYAIQGYGSCMVKEISGSYTNVVGLPVPEVIEALLAMGAIELA
jgi:septum formation protein